MSEPAFPARRCVECGTLYGHPPTTCRACGSETFEDETLQGTAELYASTVIRVPGSDHQGQEPFEVGLVDVGATETVRVTARLEGPGDAVPDLAPGAPLAFVEQRGGVFVFRPA